MGPDDEDKGSDGEDNGIDIDSADMESLRGGGEPDVQFRSAESDADER
jgi:hypothetical protein